MKILLKNKKENHAIQKETYYVIITIIFISIVTLFSLLSQSVNVAYGESESKVEYIEGEVIVKYKEDRINIENPSIVQNTQLFFAELGIDESIENEEQNTILYIENDKSTSQLVKQFEDNPNVEYVEPNYIFSVSGEPEDDEGELSDPNDPEFDKQWSFDNDAMLLDFNNGVLDVDIRAKESWGLTDLVDTEIVVGIIDTGVDYTHPDLRDNIWINAGEFPDSEFPGIDADNNGKIIISELENYSADPLMDFNSDSGIDLLDLLTPDASNVFLNSVDDDGNGYVDDFIGWDFENDDNNPMDDHSHGTHVAGTIAATRNNGIGVAGVNSKAKILPLKVFDSGGSGGTNNINNAIYYANQMGVTITNNSWGITIEPGFAPNSIRDAIQDAESKGYLFIASSGNGHFNDGLGYDIDNDSQGCSFYPGAYDLDNIITVTSTDNSDELSSFSNWGATSVDIAAPGEVIYSTALNGGYLYKSGTSMATPHVTGIISSLWTYLVNQKGQNPNYLEIKNTLIDRSDQINSLHGLTISDNDEIDGKRVDLYSLLPPTLQTEFDPLESSGDLLDGSSVVVSINSDKPGVIDGQIIDSVESFDYLFETNGFKSYEFTDNTGYRDSGSILVDWILNTSIDSPSSEYINIQNEENFNLSGTCYKNLDVDISINDLIDNPSTLEITKQVQCQNGSWEINLTELSTLNDGVIEVEVSQINTPIIESSTYSLIKDTTIPSDFTVKSPKDGTSSTSSSVNVTGSGEANGLITVTGGVGVDVGSINSEGEFLVAVELNRNQINNLQINMMDVAGNRASNSIYLSIRQKKKSGSSSSSSSNNLVKIEETVFIGFQDTEGTTFENYIDGLGELSIVSGYPDGTYRPDELVKRDQLAKYIVKAFNIELNGEGEYFPDVSPESSLGVYIQTLKNMGIVDGFSDGGYHPGLTVSRGEVTKFIVTSFMLTGEDIFFPQENPYSDVDDMIVFKQYIFALSNRRNEDEAVISGYPDGTYKPDKSISRGELAKIIWNSIESID